uniref:Protein RIC1 homolog n=1 Tax=Trichobilharzia regenti TaxID=157069 RepID=A0AA85KK30_TRIRE|nr:unnamed protein product [Trichobilharzia regenti]
MLCTEKGVVIIYCIDNLPLSLPSVPHQAMDIFTLGTRIKVAECCCNAFCLGEIVVIATVKGDLVRINWDGSYFGTTLSLTSIGLKPNDMYYNDDKTSELRCYCKTLEWAPTFGGAFSLISSGHVAFITSLDSSEDQMPIEAKLVENATNSTSTAVNNRFRTLAVGTQSSEVLLYRMDEVSGTVQVQHTLQMHSRESSCTREQLGAVSEVVWSPDGYTLAVAWLHCGWALWSVFGALIYSSFGERINPLYQVHVSNLSWGHHGYNVLGSIIFTKKAISEDADVMLTEFHSKEKSNLNLSKEEGDSIQSPDSFGCQNSHSKRKSYLVVFRLTKSAVTANPTSDNRLHLVLQYNDRIAVIGEKQMVSGVQIQNLVVPKEYMNSNWPIRYVAVSRDGKDIAVSGRSGFVHYKGVSQRWYVFGNVKQENSFHVFGGIAWWKQYICCSCLMQNYDSSEVRVYSSLRKLDEQFCSVYQFSYLVLPVVVDSFQNWFLMLANDGCLWLFELTESDTVVISPLKVINLTDFVVFPACVVQICLTALKSNALIAAYQPSVSSDQFLHCSSNRCSTECLLINYSDEPSGSTAKSTGVNETQLHFGKPFLIASESEVVWSAGCFGSFKSSSQHSLPKSSYMYHINPYTSDSLWFYSGASGFSVWLALPPITSSSSHINSVVSDDTYVNSVTSENPSTHTYNFRRIMLSVKLNSDFYPLSIFFPENLLVGITNDFHRCWNVLKINAKEDKPSDIFTLFPYGVFFVEIQITLHQIIQQLLKKNLGAHAFQMSLVYQNLEYFPRTLELLLHEVLEVEAASKIPTPDPLLPQVVALIQQFPNFLEILAHCSRKTDVSWWPHLFTTIGRKPRDLFELCLENHQLETAASYLIILQTSEAVSVSWECALNLFRASLQLLKWNLIRDILRFLCSIGCNELNSINNDRVIAHVNKSRLSILSPCNHNYSVSKSQNYDAQPQASKMSRSRIVWYNEISKYQPTFNALKLLNLENNQCKDMDSSFVTATHWSFSDIRPQLKEIVSKMTIEYFSQGYLKRASQLITNIPEIFIDDPSFSQTNVLADWIVKHICDLQPAPSWPQAFYNLLIDFSIFTCTIKNETHFISKEASVSQPFNSVQVVKDGSTFPFDTCSIPKQSLYQLNYLLNQLNLANCHNWECLINLLCLDRDAFLRSVNMAATSAILSFISALNVKEIPDQISASNISSNESAYSGVDHTSAPNVRYDFGYARQLFSGLEELKHWSSEKYPLYYEFLISCEPELNEISNKLKLHSNGKGDLKLQSIFAAYGFHDNEEDIFNILNRQNIKIDKSLPYTGSHFLISQQTDGVNHSASSFRRRPVSLGVPPSSASDGQNPVNTSVFLNSVSKSQDSFQSMSSCSTPLILNVDNVNTDYYESMKKLELSVHTSIPHINDDEMHSENGYLFNALIENEALDSESNRLICSVM